MRYWLTCALCGAHITAAPAQQLDQAARLLPVREVFRHGGDAVDSSVAFASITAIGLGPRGQIVVLDSDQRRAAVFEATGAFLRFVGRSGSGPGEFQHISGMQVDSFITIFDPVQRRYSVFDFDGRHRQTSAAPDNHGLLLTSFSPAGRALVGATAARFTRTTSAEKEGTVAVVLVDGLRVDTLIEFRSAASTWFVPGRPAPWGAFIASTGDGGAWLAYSDTVVVGNGVTGQLKWFTASSRLRPVKELSLQQPGRRVTDAERSAFIANLKETRSYLPRTFEIDAPQYWSAIAGMTRGSDGSLWIRSASGQGPGSAYSEITPRGEVRRWILPRGFVLHALQGSRMFGSELTAMDAPTLVVYERTR